MTNEPIGWYHEQEDCGKFELTPEEEIELREKLTWFIDRMKKKKIKEQPDTFHDDELFTIE